MNNVYVNLVGGVGNQLFQIAAGYAYAKKNKKVLVLDDSAWSGSQGTHPFHYRKTIYKNFKFSVYRPRPTRKIHEKKFNYTELPYEKGDVDLHGYFQSIKYFEEFSEEFKSILCFDDVKFDIKNDLHVAAHVRRGDYLKHHNIHYICDTNYFLKGFSFFPYEMIDIYTDSMDHVVNEFKDHQNIRYINCEDELKCLYILSQYDNLIASNSSFSWWASFLGKEKKTIIVPDLWFKNFEQHDDIYRKEFTRIPV